MGANLSAKAVGGIEGPMFRATRAKPLPRNVPRPARVSALPAMRWRAGLWTLETRDLRDHGFGRHRAVDDTPAGGGPGMVMRADVLAAALDAVADDSTARAC